MMLVDEQQQVAAAATAATANLPPDLVAAVLHHAPLSTVMRSARVCRDWRDASRTDTIAMAVLMRRWKLPQQLLNTPMAS